MSKLCSLVAIFLMLSAATRVAAEPAQPPIRVFDLPTLEALGREIYRQDTAAWVGSDALMAQVPNAPNAHLVGWIVVPHGMDERVRFLRDVGNGPEAGYDIDVDSKRHVQVSEPAERRLSPDELAAFAARQTAIQNTPNPCRAGYNTVVARDPAGGGWLAWMLAPMPAIGDIPIGGHYRFTISRDGKTIVQRDALSASCMVMHPPNAKEVSGKPAIAVVTNVVASTPLETHVFLQLQSHLPMVVLAGDRKWAIENGQIRDIGKIEP